MKVRILTLVAMLAIGASVAAAQAPVKEKGKSSEAEKKGDHEKWGHKHGPKKGSDDDDRRGNAAWGGQRRLLGGIQLTDAQKASIKTIHAKYEPKMVAIRDSMKANREAGVKPVAADPLRTRAMNLAKQERAEIRAVLTAEQQVRFDQNVAKFDDRMDKRRDGREKRGDRGDRLQ